MPLTPLLMVSLVMAGGGLALALYFGALAALRRSGEFYLLSALLLLAAARALLPALSGVGPLAGQISPDALRRFDGVSLLMIGGLYGQFLRALFPEDVPVAAVRAGSAGCGAALLVVLLLPSSALPGIMDWVRVLLMVVLLAAAALSVVLMQRWRDGALWVAGSVLVLVAAVLTDLFLRHRSVPEIEIPGTLGVISTGCVLFALGHVFLMGARLNRVYQTSQTLSRHVVALNRSLEKRVTEASRETNATREQLEAILSCVPDGVITLTVDGTIDIFGPGAERVFGWRGHEVSGLPVVTLLSPEWGERLLKSLRRFVTEGVLTYTGQGPVEMEGRRRDGALFPMICTVTRIDINGQPVFVATIRDASADLAQQQQVTEMQRQCERRRQDLALIEARGGVGHFVAQRGRQGYRYEWSDGFAAVWGLDRQAMPSTLAGALGMARPDDQRALFPWLDRQDWTSGSRVLRVCADVEEERVIELSLSRERDAAGQVTRELGVVRLIGVGTGGGQSGEDAMETVSAAGVDGVRTILLVEDVEVNRRVAVTFLEREGYRVEVASTGLEAVEMAGQGDYDLILMDIRLPDVDGVEATRRIRALPDPARAAVPVLALTANVFGDDVSRYEAAGMSGVVAKPIRMPQFRTVLSGLLSRRKTAAAGGPGWTSLDLPLDEAFIRERQAALGADSFAVILDLGRRSSGFAAEELERSVMTAAPVAADVARAAHKLAGAASNFGFAALYALGRQVEALCEAGDLAQALQVGQRAGDLRRQTDAALDRWLAESR